MLRGSLLGSSMNSQVFRSSHDLKMRRFFFSERKNVQFFRSMKWLELIESEILLASGDVLASVSFWKKGPSHLGSSENFTSKPQYLETYIDLLWIENRVARQLVCVLPRSMEFHSIKPVCARRWHELPTSQRGAWRAGIYLCGGSHRISLSTFAYAKTKTWLVTPVKIYVYDQTYAVNI